MRPVVGLLASAALAAALFGASATSGEAAPRGFGPGGASIRTGSHGAFGRYGGDRGRFGHRGAGDFYGYGYGRGGLGYGYGLGGFGGYGLAGYGFGFGSYGLYDPLGDYGRFGGRDETIVTAPPPPSGPPAVLGVRDAPVLPPAIYVLGGKGRRSAEAAPSSNHRGAGAMSSTSPARIIAVR